MSSYIDTISIIGNNSKEWPMWAINHFVDDFCCNYSKLLIIERICVLFTQGIDDDQLYVFSESMPMFSNSDTIIKLANNSDKMIEFSLKSQSPADFWNIITRYKRPMVYIKDNNEIRPIYDIDSDESIKIRRMSLNSPFEMDPHGVVNTIIDLVEAKPKYEMHKEEHAARQITELARGYENICRAARTINDPSVPLGVQVYANQGLEALLKKQAQLNKQLDIRIKHIDSRI